MRISDSQTQVKGFLSPSSTLFLHGPALILPAIPAHPATAQFGLLPELGDVLGACPTRAGQIVVVLIAILVKSSPHFGIGRVPSKCSIAHDDHLIVAGATRVLGIDQTP